MSDTRLTGEQIVALVAEVAAELRESRGGRTTIVAAGGSLLAWHGLRATTVDVDSVSRLDEQLRAAVARVAERHGLATRPLCSFDSPEQAATEMYVAFPAAIEDAHLADYVAEIARESDARS